MKGNVKFFNVTKGFGFIKAEDDNEYFVHQTGLNEGVSLNENDAVTFDTTEDERGKRAINVSLDKGGSDSAEEPEDKAA